MKLFSNNRNQKTLWKLDIPVVSLPTHGGADVAELSPEKSKQSNYRRVTKELQYESLINPPDMDNSQGHLPGAIQSTSRNMNLVP